MFWDATNSRLGIGTNAPAYVLDVVNNSRFRGTENYFGATNNNGIFSPATYSSANYPAIESNSIGFIAGITSVANTVYTVANKITFQIGTGSNSKKAEFSTSTGNLLLQNGGTFTDSGERLQVTGTMKVTGNVSAGASLLFNTTLPSRHTDTNYPAIFVGNTNSSIMAETFTGYKGINITANAVRNTTLTNWTCQDTTQPCWIQGLNYETANTDEFALSRAPATSSAASFIKLFSIKGNGYVSIGLNTTAATALTDIGASTTTRASLRIRSGTAPTSPNDGDIWFDGTDIKIRIGGVTKTFTLV
jgi:hypothetical protein